MDNPPTDSSKQPHFDFKEMEDNYVREFFSTWITLQEKPVEMTLDLAAITAAMKPKINNNRSRKYKNEVSKPHRRKIRELRNFIVDKVITDIKIASESTVDSFTVDTSVIFAHTPAAERNEP